LVASFQLLVEPEAPFQTRKAARASPAAIVTKAAAIDTASSRDALRPSDNVHIAATMLAKERPTLAGRAFEVCDMRNVRAVRASRAGDRGSGNFRRRSRLQKCCQTPTLEFEKVTK
jgi:hypothetical protein